MLKSIELMFERWSEMATVLTKGGYPWPKLVVEIDWQWLLKQKEAGAIQTLPDCVALSKRWCLSPAEARQLLQEMGVQP